MIWSLALCPDDTKQDSVVYGAEFGVVFLAKGPRTAFIQEVPDLKRSTVKGQGSLSQNLYVHQITFATAVLYLV